MITRQHKTLASSSVAHFSECGGYRYLLARTWTDGPKVNYLCLNPSTADEQVNDPTVHRLVKRAGSWGYGGVIVTNLFALRATDPSWLKLVGDPVGPENDAAILAAAAEAELVICAWGNHGLRFGRAAKVLELLAPYAAKLRALRITKAGCPEHPLYLSYDQQPVAFPAEVACG
jgi:hypothetical protein